MPGIGRKQVVKECKKQVKLAGPLFVVALSQFCVQIISVIVVGHLGELALSGASLANSFASVIAYILLMGMANALDTLCGQSFGANQHHMLGIYLQRAMFVLSIVSIFIAAILANTKFILIHVYKDHEISNEAGKYAQLLVPGVFAYGLIQCLTKFLQAQNIVTPMMLITIITTILHLPLCWILVFKSRLGGRGAALATSITSWINFLLLALYVKFSSQCANTWTGFSKEALHGHLAFVKLAITSALMTCLEGWTFELLVLLSAYLPHPELQTSVQSICQNTFGLVWMIPFGIACAASTRVSNELGAGHPHIARLAAYVAICMTSFQSIIIGLIMILVHKIWGYVFSSKKEVVKHVSLVMPIVTGASFLDALQVVIAGVARGCGWQHIGAIINLGSFYIVGVPTAVVFAFVIHLNVKGLWFGGTLALGVQVFFLSLVVVRTKWNEEARKAANRVR